MKEITAITFVVAIVLILLFSHTGYAAESAHCLTNGNRTTCFVTDSYTKATTRVTTTRIRGITTVRVTRVGYSATETTITHGKATVVTGRDSEGRRWVQHSVSTFNMSSIADTSSIASDMSIAR